MPKPRFRPRGIPRHTSLRAKLRSRPLGGHEYLDMYLMSKEMERLKGYGNFLGAKLRETLEAVEVCRKEFLKRGKRPLSSLRRRGEARGAKGEAGRGGNPPDGMAQPPTLIPLEY